MAWAAPIAASVAGAAVSGAMNKSSGGNRQMLQQPSQSSNYGSYTPHPSAAPMYGWLAENLQNLMQQRQSYYPGQGYVGPSDLTKAGVGNQQGLLGSALGNYNFLSNAADVANNPYVQGQLRANESSVMDTLKNQMLPQLQSGAQQVNALGSSRLGLAQGQAMGDASQALANQNAATMLNAYGQGLGAQTSALGQTGNMLGNLLAPGQTVEQYQQRALDDSMKRWEFAQNEPWQRMGNVGNLLSYLQPLGITTGNQVGMTSGPNPGYQSPWQSLLGGAGTGYSIWDTWNKSRTQTPSFSSGAGANAPLGYGGYTGGFGY